MKKRTIKNEKKLETTFIYELSDSNGSPFYIGKSDCPDTRKRDHEEEVGNSNKCLKIDSLKQNGQEVILTGIDSIPYFEWPYWEEFYYYLYISWGFELVNDPDSLGVGGSNLEAYWNLENVKEMARKCNSMTEFRVNYGGAYSFVKRHKLLNMIRDIIPRRSNYYRIWTKEKCVEDALKYRSQAEWRKNSEGAYSAASKHRWLLYCKESFAIQRVRRTLEDCKESAKKYTSKTEWRKSDKGAYNSAKRNNWMEQCASHFVN